MADQKDNKPDLPVILQNGVDAEEKFKWAISTHIIGRRVKGLSFSSVEEVEGEPRTTIQLDFDDGKSMMISIATDADVDFWVSREDSPEVVSKWKM